MLGAGQSDAAEAKAIAPLAATLAAGPAAQRARLPDLSPAKWIWYPSGRTLQNTFILFRRELNLSGIKWICWPPTSPAGSSWPARSDFVGVCSHYGQNAYPLETMELMRTSGVDQFRDEVL